MNRVARIVLVTLSTFRSAKSYLHHPDQKRNIKIFSRSSRGLVLRAEERIARMATLDEATDPMKKVGDQMHEVNQERKQFTVRAKIIGNDPQSIEYAGNKIREGALVAFPTETVYGLGGNIFDEFALRRIFEVKKRPMNDPLIAHVLNATAAMDLVHFGENDMLRNLFVFLAESFWPGPLTLVVPASPRVPSIVTANTGFIGIRSPSHDIAREILRCSGVPICAPSANTFGHVSPTRASHVYDDLHTNDVTIIEERAESCEIGIESTVVKLICGNSAIENEIVVLRKGHISVDNLYDKLKGSPYSSFNIRVKEYSRGSEGDELNKNNEAPGQMLKHYSPNLEAFHITKEQQLDKNQVMQTAEIHKCVVIDFGGQHLELEPVCMAYRDLSSEGNPSEAARCLFDALRWAENISGASCVLLTQIPNAAKGSLASAFNDRIFRASSGKNVFLEVET